jgi:inositol transport system permease protein
MLFIVRGITVIITNGAASRYNGPEFIWWGNGNVLGIPVPFIVFLVCAAMGAAVLRYTALGRYIFALGSNATSARVAGVPTNLVTFLVFVIVGIFTGINAMVLGSRLYSAGPGLEPGFELNVIATVVLGGTRFWRPDAAACWARSQPPLLFTTLGNILNLLQIDAFVQRVAVGLVLLIALSIEGVLSASLSARPGIIR